MKAVVLTGNESLVYQEIPTPEVKPGTVRIKVSVCGICGSDVPRVFNHGAHSYPIVLGHEFSGTIDAVGEGVQGLEIGIRVTAAPLVPCHKCPDCEQGDYALCEHYSFIGSRQQGAMAEYVVVPAENVVPISDAISFEQAATIEPATVALHALRLARFSQGKRVAVLGCGIIGLYAIQWAKLLGAASVTAIGRGEIGLNAAKELGAEFVFSTKNSPEEDLLSQFESNGYDYVLECSGSSQTIQLSLQMVAKKGIVCMIGTPKKDLIFTPSLWENINRKECWITGSWMSYSAPFPGEEWRMTVDYMRSGKLKLVLGMVRGIYPMERTIEAFGDIRRGVSGRCLLSNEKCDNTAENEENKYDKK